MTRKSHKKNSKNIEVDGKETPTSEEHIASPDDSNSVPEQEAHAPTAETDTTEPRAQAVKPSGNESAEKKLAELNEKYVRLLAEYDNYRKRTAREIENLMKWASEKLIVELLPILDNLDRATEHRNDKTTYEEYVKGITLIEDQFRAVLARAGLEPIEVIGKPFDPNIHDAIMQIESDEYESGIISAEAEKGYILGGKVIRHSKVVVSK